MYARGYFARTLPAPALFTVTDNEVAHACDRNSIHYIYVAALKFQVKEETNQKIKKNHCIFLVIRLKAYVGLLSSARHI